MATNPGVTMVMNTLTLSAPLALASMGGLTSERSGVINIALEGKMLASCICAAIVGVSTGSAVLAVLAGIAAGILMSLLHYLLTQVFGIDHIISGMGVNFVALGAGNYLSQAVQPIQQGQALPPTPIWPFWVAGILLPVGLAYALKKTRPGLRLMAVGHSPDKSRQLGVQPVLVRLGALVVTGVFCGLAGDLIVSNAGRYVDNMTAGRGYIALAALILGGWRPIPSLLACFGFGFVMAIQLQFQGGPFLGVELPPEFWGMLPFLVTVIALVGLLGGKNRAPSGLGKP